MQLQQRAGNRAVRQWLNGSSGQPQPDVQRLGGLFSRHKERHRKDLDLTQKDQLRKLDQALTKKDFIAVADALHGFIDRSGTTENFDKNKYTQDITTAFGANKWQEKYLHTVVQHGTPTPLMKLGLSLGLVTHGEIKGRNIGRPGDTDEVLRILETTDWTKHKTELEAVKANGAMWSAFQNNITRLERTSKRVENRIKAFLNVIEKKTPGTDQEELAAAEVEHLARIVANYGDGFSRRVAGVKKSEMIDGVRRWLKTASPEARKKAAQNGSAFDKKLDELVSKKTKGLKEHDKVYLITLMKSDDQGEILDKLRITAEDLNRSDETWERQRAAMATDPEKEASEAKQGLAGEAGAILDLRHLIVREQAKAAASPKKKGQGLLGGKIRHKHTKLKAKLADFAGEDKAELREHFLVTMLPDATAYWAEQDEARRWTLLDPARAKLKTELEASGMKEKEIADILGVFQYRREAGGVYRELKKLIAKAESGHLMLKEKRLPDKIYSLVLKMQGDEFRQVWADSALRNSMKAALVPKHQAVADKVLAQFKVTSFDDVSNLAGADVAEKSKKARETAEHDPQHWIGQINRRMGEHMTGHAVNWLTMPRGKLLALLHQAQSASVAAKPANAAEQKTFRESIWNGITHKKTLESAVGSYHKTKFIDGSLSANDRIDFARRGIAKHEAELRTLIETSSGKDLYELSNVSDFLGLLDEQKAKQLAYDNAPNGNEKQTAKVALTNANKKLDEFIIDLKEPVLNQLSKELGNVGGSQRTKSLVEVVSLARRKIADALADDPEFKTKLLMNNRMAEQDIPIMQERIRAMAELDEEDMSRKGIQWHSLSVKSVEQQEAVWALKGGHRAMGRELKTGGTGVAESGLYTTERIDDPTGAKQQAREGIVKSRSAEIEAAREEWSRRKESFEAMQKKYNDRIKKLVMLIIGAAVAVGVGFLTAGAAPLVAAAIKFAISIAMKAIEVAVDRVIYGHVELTGKELLQKTLMTFVEAGTAMATAAFDAEVIKPWWSQMTTVQDAIGTGDNAIAGSGLAQTWYKENGLFTFGGLAAEATKTSVQSFVNKATFGSFVTLADEMMFQDDPLGQLRRNPGAAVQGKAIAEIEGVLMGFAQNMAGNFAKDVVMREQLQEAGRLQQEHHDRLVEYRAAVEAHMQATGQTGTVDEWISQGNQLTTGITTGPIDLTAAQGQLTVAENQESQAQGASAVANSDAYKNFQEATAINNAWNAYDNLQQAQDAYDQALQAAGGDASQVDSQLVNNLDAANNAWSNQDQSVQTWYSTNDPANQTVVTDNLTSANQALQSHAEYSDWVSAGKPDSTAAKQLVQNAASAKSSAQTNLDIAQRQDVEARYTAASTAAGDYTVSNIHNSSKQQGISDLAARGFGSDALVTVTDTGLSELYRVIKESAVKPSVGPKDSSQLKGHTWWQETQPKIIQLESTFGTFDALKTPALENKMADLKGEFQSINLEANQATTDTKIGALQTKMDQLQTEMKTTLTGFKNSATTDSAAVRDPGISSIRTDVNGMDVGAIETEVANIKTAAEDHKRSAQALKNKQDATEEEKNYATQELEKANDLLNEVQALEEQIETLKRKKTALLGSLDQATTGMDELDRKVGAFDPNTGEINKDKVAEAETIKVALTTQQDSVRALRDEKLQSLVQAKTSVQDKKTTLSGKRDQLDWSPPAPAPAQQQGNNAALVVGN